MRFVFLTAMILDVTAVEATPWQNLGQVTAQQQAAQLAYANAPYTVTADTHMVVMEYEAWWGPGGNHFEGTGKVPTLSSASMKAQGLIGYDSADPLVIQQHADWMVGMGVDAIMLDETNGVACSYASDINKFCQLGATPQSYHDYLAVTPANNVKIFQYYRDNQVPLKIIPLIGGQDEDTLIVDSDGQTNLQKQIARYQMLLKDYPNQWVYYQGKPLLTFFSSAPMKPNMVTAVNQYLAASGLDKVFTVRFLTCYADSQPSLYSVVSGQLGLHQSINNYWSFIDRFRPDFNLLPIYAANGGVVEAFTAAIGFPSAEGAPASWDGASAGHRLNYFTFQTFVDRAKILRPTFLVIDQFNEFVQPDQGYTAENTNDIEPTDLWGTSALEAVGKSVADYKQAVGGLVLSRANFAESLNLSSRSPSATSYALGYFRTISTGQIFNSNGEGHYCLFPSPSSFSEAGGTMLAVRDVDAVGVGMIYDGDCHVPIRKGFFRVQNGTGVYGADGAFNYCLYPDPKSFAAAGGTAQAVRNLDSFLEFNNLTGVCK